MLVRPGTIGCWALWTPVVAEIVVAPPLEALLVTGISDALAVIGDTATVATRVANPRPARAVRVRRSGGSRSVRVIDTNLVLIECWDDDGVQAESLAGLISGVITSLDGQMVTGHMILSALILGGPANDPDPDSDTPRYTLTAEVRTKARPL